MTKSPRPYGNLPGVIIGITIMAFGLVLLLDQAGVIDRFDYVSFWPVAFITIGLVKLSHRRHDGRREGGWWLFIGAWMLLHAMHVLRMRDSWPLFLVAIGISLVWKEARTRARVE